MSARFNFSMNDILHDLLSAQMHGSFLEGREKFALELFSKRKSNRSALKRRTKKLKGLVI
nr:MAG TPA: hypothetical protein [Caudoviricetes sp.]